MQTEAEGPIAGSPSHGPRRTVIAVAAAVIVIAAGIGLWGIGSGWTSGRPDAGPSASLAVRSDGPTASPRPVAVDSGAGEHATGAATALQPGRFRYVVAPGDTPYGITTRFHVCLSDVTGGVPLAMQNAVLQPGEVVEVRLDPTSVWADGSIHCTSS